MKLVVDPMSLDLVRGSAVDFVEDLGGAAFKVTNPNAAVGLRLRVELLGLTVIARAKAQQQRWIASLRSQ